MQVLRVSRTAAALVTVVVLTGLLGLTVAGQQRSNARPTIQGVWRIVERTTTVPSADGLRAAGTRSNPEPGLYLFTGKYYSQVVVTSDRPRPDLPDAEKASADQLRAAWGPFIGNAGMYSLASGNLITLQAIVSKTPVTMKPGNSATWSYTLAGDTLVMTQKSTQDGPAVGPATLKFTRVE